MKQYPHEDSDGIAPRSLKRRSLIRAGLAAPAVLTLASAPVQAANCKSPSGFSVSGNLSRNAGLGCTDGISRSPSFWAANNNGTTYQGNSIAPTTLFSTVFGAVQSPYTDGSFADVLVRGNTNDQAMIAAVFLEAALSSGSGSYPDQLQVKAMWAGMNSSLGYAVPNSPGLNWNKPAILKYLLYLTGQTTS